jgi:hypothetical protein
MVPSPGVRQLVQELSAAALGQALQSEGRAEQVPAEAFETFGARGRSASTPRWSTPASAPTRWPRCPPSFALPTTLRSLEST